MNVFKKFFEDLKERLRFDVRFKDRGICFNVDLDPKGESTMALGAFGIGNQVGGAILCVLESKGEADSHFCPRTTNMANRFLFLNGMLLPDDVSRETTLASYLGIMNMDPLKSFRNSVELNRGYTLHFMYVPAKDIRELSVNEELFDEVMLDNFNLIMPADKTTTLIKCAWMDEDDVTGDWLTTVIDEFSTDYKTIVPPEDGATHLYMIVTYLATYCYSNILNRIHDEMAAMITTCNVPEIPWLNANGEQEKWVAKLKKSVKDDEVWKKFEDTFLQWVKRES